MRQETQKLIELTQRISSLNFYFTADYKKKKINPVVLRQRFSRIIKKGPENYFK
jgi:hypothetical protein